MMLGNEIFQEVYGNEQFIDYKDYDSSLGEQEPKRVVSKWGKPNTQPCATWEDMPDGTM